MTAAVNPLDAYLQRELSRLRDEWQALVNAAPELPGYSWADLAEVLLDTTSIPAEELLLRGALAALVKTAQFKPKAMVLREILMLAASASNQQLISLLTREEDDMR